MHGGGTAPCVASRLHAVPRNVVMRRHKRVGRVAALHAQEPVLVRRALVRRVLGPAHARAGRPQELLVELVGVQGDGEQAAVAGAGAGHRWPARPPLAAVGRPAQLELTRVLDEEVAEEGGGVLHAVRGVAGGGREGQAGGQHQPPVGEVNIHDSCPCLLLYVSRRF
jgi:hypothetical protein